MKTILELSREYAKTVTEDFVTSECDPIYCICDIKEAYRAGFRAARELAVKAAEDRAREDMLHWDEITGGNGWRMVVCTSRMIASDIRKLGEDDSNLDDNGMRLDGN